MYFARIKLMVIVDNDKSVSLLMTKWLTETEHKSLSKNKKKVVCWLCIF